MEDVASIHPYHTIGYSAMGNPAPQTDLFADEYLGGNTLLLIGDGTYGCRYDLAPISKFHMYPFNDDWMSSLFFSQDEVAIDSVMYDFLYAEGTGPSEGAQNYLHQAADPPENRYDPENDGQYLNESLGVHEHWDMDFDIFESDRYSGVIGNGIDYVALGEEYASFGVKIVNPKIKHLYIAGNELRYLSNLKRTIIIGKIGVTADVNGNDTEIEKVEFYIDGNLKFTDYEVPFEWVWKRSFFLHTIDIIAYENSGDSCSDELEVWKFL